MAKSERELREQMLKDLRERQAKAAREEPLDQVADAAPATAARGLKSSGTLAHPQGTPESDSHKKAEVTVVRRFWGRIVLGICCFVLVLILIGKQLRRESDPWDRRPVFGTITAGGKLVAGGMISFYPLEAGPIAITQIENGRYQFSRADGPVVGPNRVVVSFFRDTADMDRFKIPTAKGTRPAESIESSGSTNPPAAPAEADGRTNLHKFEFDVPATGSPQKDIAVPG